MHETDFEKHRELIESFPIDQIKSPRIPAKMYAQEAEDLANQARIDATALEAVGVYTNNINLLFELSGALHHVCSIRNLEQDAQTAAMKEWTVLRDEAEKLKENLIHVFRFGFDGEEDLIQSLNRIEEGESNADLVQDMSDLALLGKRNTALIENYMDINLLTKSAEYSDRLGQTLAVVNGERNLPEASREMRDKVYTLLKKEVDRVRKCGKFLFWKDNAKLRKYASAYERTYNKSRERKAQETNELN